MLDVKLKTNDNNHEGVVYVRCMTPESGTSPRRHHRRRALTFSLREPKRTGMLYSAAGIVAAQDCTPAKQLRTIPFPHMSLTAAAHFHDRQASRHQHFLTQHGESRMCALSPESS
jgi:hypothetical protein